MTDTLDELEKLLAEWKQACTRIDDPLQKDVIKLKALELALGIESALPELLAEIEVLRRLSPEYFQWPGKSGANTVPEWLQDRLKYGGASVDGDMLAVYDWYDRRSLAAPGDYVVDGEQGLCVLVNARAALKGT